MPVDQSLECSPCHQTDWRTEPPEASLPSKWLPSTDGELDPQEPPTCPPLFHPNSRADQPPQVPPLTICESCQRKDREELQAPWHQNNLQIERNPYGIFTECCTCWLPIITLLALNLGNMLDLAFQARIIFCHIQYIEAILKELEICRQPSMWTQWRYINHEQCDHTSTNGQSRTQSYNYVSEGFSCFW